MTNICTKVTVRKRPIKTVSCRFTLTLPSCQTPEDRQTDKEGVSRHIHICQPDREV